jgi:hypothetical protein
MKEVAGIGPGWWRFLFEDEDIQEEVACRGVLKQIEAMKMAVLFSRTAIDVVCAED